MILSNPLTRAVVALLAVQGTTGAPTVSTRECPAPKKYTIPRNSPDPGMREVLLDVARTHVLYGPPVAGGPAYPAGPLGSVRGRADLLSLQADLKPAEEATQMDAQVAAASHKRGKYNGLRSRRDYELLYDGNWVNSLPRGPVPGVMTNYTQDLLFSMERLSISPYAIRRLIPGTDKLPFQFDGSIARVDSGESLEELLEQGRLFYVDHSDQAHLPRTERFAPACDALFFIEQGTDDFLPLAIRTDAVGHPDIVYTAADDERQWLLAKIMFNVNDFWFAQWHHLAATHQVHQITWLAAIRSLSVEHPVYAILNRLTYQAFALQPLAASILFEPGGAVDQVFGHTGAAAQDYVTGLYHNGTGDFRANYFRANLRRRGLIDSPVGPALKHFPFYEDAVVIDDAVRAFLATFVESYYATDADVAGDVELQAWCAEANGDAHAHDFPEKIDTRQTLIDVIAHLAHLGGTAHHAVNTNELLSISSTLPFHPPALYAPVPEGKGAAPDIVEFLPPFEQVVVQLGFAGLFARPLLEGGNRTLTHMFDFGERVLNEAFNPQTAKAAGIFKSEMEKFSDVVAQRRFDAQGLCQGMPFVWQALDPRVALYSVTV